MKPWIYVTTISSLFLGGPLLAGAAGYWQTGISKNEYLFHVQNLHLPFYQHSGEIPTYNKDAWLRMMAEIRKSQGAMSRNHANGESSNNN